MWGDEHREHPQIPAILVLLVTEFSAFLELESSLQICFFVWLGQRWRPKIGVPLVFCYSTSGSPWSHPHRSSSSPPKKALHAWVSASTTVTSNRPRPFRVNPAVHSRFTIHGSRLLVGQKKSWNLNRSGRPWPGPWRLDNAQRSWKIRPLKEGDDSESTCYSDFSQKMTGFPHIVMSFSTKM